LAGGSKNNIRKGVGALLAMGIHNDGSAHYPFKRNVPYEFKIAYFIIGRETFIEQQALQFVYFAFIHFHFSVDALEEPQQFGDEHIVTTERRHP
jgi:hypothetical protein